MTGWRTSSIRGRQRAVLVLVLGFALCGVWSWIVSSFGHWLDGQGMAAWDERALRWIEANGPLNFTNAILAESPGNLSYLVPLTTAVAIFAFMRGRTMVGLGMLLAYWGARPLVFLGWQAWDRARPDLIAGGVASPALHSFPSGHAALSTVTYGFLAFLWIRRSGARLEQILAVLVTSGARRQLGPRPAGGALAK